jgi:hypothetical protein
MTQQGWLVLGLVVAVIISIFQLGDRARMSSQLRKFQARHNELEARRHDLGGAVIWADGVIKKEQKTVGKLRAEILTLRAKTGKAGSNSSS